MNSLDVDKISVIQCLIRFKVVVVVVVRNEELEELLRKEQEKQKDLQLRATALPFKPPMLGTTSTSDARAAPPRAEDQHFTSAAISGSVRRGGGRFSGGVPFTGPMGLTGVSTRNWAADADGSAGFSSPAGNAPAVRSRFAENATGGLDDATQTAGGTDFAGFAGSSQPAWNMGQERSQYDNEHVL